MSTLRFAIRRRDHGTGDGAISFLNEAEWEIQFARQAEGNLIAVDNLDTLGYVAVDQARDTGLPIKRGEFSYEK